MIQKLIFAVLILFSFQAYSAQLDMLEHNIPLAQAQGIEKVFVSGARITVQSYIKPCAHYPGYPNQLFGDLYECVTDRNVLAQLTGDQSVLTVPDQVLANAIFNAKVTYQCNETKQPVKIKHQGKTVYRFSGPLVGVK